MMAKKRKKPVPKRKAKVVPVSPEEKIERKLLADIGGGAARPRDLVIATVGKHRKIAWWDMVRIEDPEFYVDELGTGQFMTCGLDDIPTPVWQAHLADYAREGGHGLNLAADPAIMGIFRYESAPEERKFGVLVGYSAKYEE